MSNLKVAFEISDLAQARIKEIAARHRELITRMKTFETGHHSKREWTLFLADSEEAENLMDEARELIANDIVDQLDEFFEV